MVSLTLDTFSKQEPNWAERMLSVRDTCVWWACGHIRIKRENTGEHFSSRCRGQNCYENAGSRKLALKRGSRAVSWSTSLRKASLPNGLKSMYWSRAASPKEPLAGSHEHTQAWGPALIIADGMGSCHIRLPVLSTWTGSAASHPWFLVDLVNSNMIQWITAVVGLLRCSLLCEYPKGD